MNFDSNSNTQEVATPQYGGFSSGNQQQSGGQSFISGLLTTVTNSALSYGEGYLERNIDSALSNI